MAKSRKRGSIPRVLRQPSNGIVGYEATSLEEQMSLFSGLIQREGGKAVQELWRTLDDPCARSYVMEQLGCFAGPHSPQSFFLPRFENRRAAGAEVSRQIKGVKKYIEGMEESVRRFGSWDLRSYPYEQLIAESRGALATLQNIKTVSSKYFGGPADRETRNIVEAQEFVKRRSSFLGSPVTLNTVAIADILELNELGLDAPGLKNTSQDLEGWVRKSLLRFRKKPEYQEYMSAMGESIRDWTLPRLEGSGTNGSLK
jgi:hypothetical protein